MMEIEDILIYYWLITGFICGLWYMIVIYPSPEWEDKVRDIVWNSGLNDDFIRSLGFAICITFGFYLVPSKICKCIKKLFSREEN